ncbi:MAG: SDR family NAD(P)-dependent oxidoreductase [Victivallaceae bacterium]|nr:SDR family NAD(P)-dependent oxidoreductase [Victivallaceae bacterium]
MTVNCFDLSGRRALVTGSSRGIGKAIAMRLGEAGAKEVIFHASKDSEALNRTLEEARGRGISCRSLAADLADGAATDELASRSGDVDLLILNASIQKYATVEEFDPAEFEREFAANVGASFRLIKAFLPGMTARGFGRIVSIGSINQWRQSPRLAIYAATKSAQNNLISNVAREYAKYGITANNVAPGVIDTDRNHEVLTDPALAAALLSRIPAGRFGTPDDCSGLVLLLCSNAGSYINGGDFPVAGGMQL